MLHYQLFKHDPEKNTEGMGTMMTVLFKQSGRDIKEEMISLCGIQSWCLWGAVMSDVLHSRLKICRQLPSARRDRADSSIRLVNARKNIFIHGYFNFYQARDEKAKHLQFILNQMMVVTEKACLKSQFRLLSF